MTGAEVLALVQVVRRPAWLPASYVMAHAQIESTFDPLAVAGDFDSTGSLGLMQVEAATAKQMGIKGDQRDPDVSLRTGIAYIAWLHAFLQAHDIDVTDYAGTIAEAYNEGCGNRAKGRRDPAYAAKWTAAQKEWAHVD